MVPPRWSDWNIKYTRKGLLKQRVQEALLFSAFAAMLVGAYWARKDGGTLIGLPRDVLRMSMQSVLSVLRRGLDTVQDLVSA